MTTHTARILFALGALLMLSARAGAQGVILPSPREGNPRADRERPPQVCFIDTQRCLDIAEDPFVVCFLADGERCPGEPEFRYARPQELPNR